MINREADWSVRYGRNHVAVANLRNQIRDIRRSIRSELGRIEETVKSEYEKQVKDTLKEREALIKDRVRTIIAQSDPEKLVGGSEPGLETLRRQVKYQLDTIVGEGMIEEVLVPKCIPFRTDY